MSEYNILTGVGVLAESAYAKALAKRESDLPLLSERLVRINERILPLFESTDLIRWFNDDKYSKKTYMYADGVKEYYSFAITRSGDELFHWKYMIDMYERSVRSVIFDGNTRKNVTWRIPPEIAVASAPQMVEVREDGPDKDFISDVRGVMDHDWFMIKMYTRFSVDG